MKLVALFAALMMLSACAQTRMYNPNVSNEQAQRDFRYCQYEAEKYGHVDMWGDTGVGAGIEEGLRKNKITRMCLEQKGYHAQ